MDHEPKHKNLNYKSSQKKKTTIKVLLGKHFLDAMLKFWLIFKNHKLVLLNKK